MTVVQSSPEQEAVFSERTALTELDIFDNPAFEVPADRALLVSSFTARIDAFFEDGLEHLPFNPQGRPASLTHARDANDRLVRSVVVLEAYDRRKRTKSGHAFCAVENQTGETRLELHHFIERTLIGGKVHLREGEKQPFTPSAFALLESANQQLAEIITRRQLRLGSVASSSLHSLSE